MAAEPRLTDGAERLLDAAERLVAVTGPHVSLREITLAAGHRNSSAVAYHFGDRQALLDAVWRRRTAVTNARRAELLAKLEAAGHLEDLEGLVEAHVLPFVELMARADRATGRASTKPAWRSSRWPSSRTSAQT